MYNVWSQTHVHVEHRPTIDSSEGMKSIRNGSLRRLDMVSSRDDHSFEAIEHRCGSAAPIDCLAWPQTASLHAVVATVLSMGKLLAFGDTFVSQNHLETTSCPIDHY
jgi:hypothetical protein